MATTLSSLQQQTDPFNELIIDHLTLSRAKHRETRDERIKSVSDNEVDAASDWSDSDRECCPLSDLECASNHDESIDELTYPTNSNERKNTFLEQISHFSSTITTGLVTDESAMSTQISFTNEIEKPIRHQYVKRTQNNQTQQRKSIQAPLLPARRSQIRASMARRSSIRSTTTTSQSSFSSHTSKPIRTSPSRLYLRRETTATSSTGYLTKDSRLSPNSSIHSHDKSLLDDHHYHRRNISPNFSQSSVSRDVKKSHTDEHDYGRLTDANNRKSSPLRDRQKWGTIVHPPFPLGYQQITSEQLTQTVERLASPVRCRDRHAVVQSPSKRYLTIDETTALINRLSKVKTIRTPDQYWPAQRASRSVKTLTNNNNNTNWKTVGAPA